MKFRILKVSNDREIKRKDTNAFIGVYISEEIDAQLKLLTITAGASRSTLIRKLVGEQLESLDLIGAAVARLVNLHEQKGEIWSGMPTHLFKIRVGGELEQRGIKADVVKEILDLFETEVRKADQYRL